MAPLSDKRWAAKPVNSTPHVVDPLVGRLASSMVASRCMWLAKPPMAWGHGERWRGSLGGGRDLRASLGGRLRLALPFEMFRQAFHSFLLVAVFADLE